ncbi:hypothetical protein [Legionella birminghamensis]|uniref:hypothetical protein n=1 Tax=Legionella birminghamensis TaxID=28083 RepID=UPI00104132B4|nr:hypothetical protein [Legionella birminghamensis]
MPTTAILTSFMHQRGGDLVAATSFMKALLAQSPDMKFEWIVKRDISSYQKDLQEFLEKELGTQSHLVSLTVIDSADYDRVSITSNGIIDNKSGQVISSQQLTELSDKNWGTVQTGWHGWKDIHRQIRTGPIASKLASVDVIAVIGNPHRLVREDHDELHRFGKKIITVAEYGLSHVNNRVYYPSDVVMRTGFGSGEKGVYIDSTVTSNDGFETIDPLDKSFLTHLINNSDVSQKALYHENTQLFYGYFFDNDRLTAARFNVKAESYIQNAIKLAIDRGEKLNIDIVIPGFINPDDLQKIYENALNTLAPEYRSKIAKARYDLKGSSDEFTSKSLINTGQTDGFNIRLINPKRLQRSTVQAVLNESDPFVGLTGDASWIEGLMKGKITCYQTMQWKQGLYAGFIQYLESKPFLKNSPLLHFYKLQAPNSRSPADCWQEMCKLYRNHKEQMLADASALAAEISAEKDINKNLIPEFIKIALQEASRRAPRAEAPKVQVKTAIPAEAPKVHVKAAIPPEPPKVHVKAAIPAEPPKVQVQTAIPAEPMATAPARENVNAEQIRKLKKLVKLCENYKNHLQRSTTKDPSNLANQKYDIVSKMLNSLSDPAVPDPQAKISNMEAHLTEQNKGILQTRRNSSIDQIFLEGLFNVLTLGIYSKISKGTFAFWKTHGEVVVEDIDEIKNQPKN